MSQIEPSDLAGIGITGSAGRLISRILGVGFVNEVPAQAAAIGYLYPEIKEASIIEMGGQDSKLIFVAREGGVVSIRDFSLNSVCAAGTGSFLDQQAQRLGVDIENEFGELALESKNVPRMAGRCSVFAKSDMIHLQQQATPMCDIVAGLCAALARNLKSNLGCGRKFVKPIIFTGGVAANIGVVRAIEDVFGLAGDEFFVPREHFFTGALGAVLVSKSKGNGEQFGGFEASKLEKYLNDRGLGLKGAKRRERLEVPVFGVPASRVYSELLEGGTEQLGVYIGLDVGSISTNVVVMDEERRILSKAYLMTAGRPLEAIKEGLSIVGREVSGKVRVLGAASTGSGRYLTGDFIGADVVINEITAQAAGSRIVNPDVDTIFEIGGQDSKYISLENGVVVDFEMNHACAAGTGSFLEEQSQRLGLNIKDEFSDLAFKSSAPIRLGERCTVFIESDLLSYQQRGAKTEDLVSGLSYSIVANYLNRVVGRRKIGDNICFQGGTAFNKAVWAAFEKVTGKPIRVVDHHEVTGALGAASIAAEHMKLVSNEGGQKCESKFKGFDNLIGADYKIETFVCEHCANNCEIKKVEHAGSEPLYYGSRCDRYNLKKKTNKSNGFDAFGYRERKLFEYAGLGGKGEKTVEGSVKIGIPMTLISWQLLPLFSQFFKSLGFEVIVSGKTNHGTIFKGLESVTSQICFPVKVAYGHVAELVEKGVDYIFVPSIVSMTASFEINKHNQLCPYVQSLPYHIAAAFEGKLGKSEILSVPMRLGSGERQLIKSFVELGKKLGVSAGDVKKGIKKAFFAQDGFEEDIRRKGVEILNGTADTERLFVIVSRPYNGCDEGVNLQVVKKLRSLGVNTIPMDMLNLGGAELGDDSLHRDVYWSYGQKILRAAEIIKRDDRLFAIYLSNFGCGPDSFLQTFFKDMISKKPSLQLELDEHSADAGLITRLEAFLESLKHYKGCGGRDCDKKRLAVRGKSSKRKLFIPYMSDCSYGVAASFRAFGQPAEVMNLADEKTLLKGRRFTTGKECLPCAITSGEMLDVIDKSSLSPERIAFFVPGGCGPCRFGMYNHMHRLILGFAGAGEAKVFSPNQDTDFYMQLLKDLKGRDKIVFMRSVWMAAGGIDLLHKLFLKIRGYCKYPEQVQQVYERSLAKWVKGIEGRLSMGEMVGLMESISEDFGGLDVDSIIRKPMVGIVGEIYVRNHPFANGNIVRRLEKLGAVCQVASLAEWIYYTNFTRIRKAVEQRYWKDLLVNKIQDRSQHWIEKKLGEPLERRFGELCDGKIEDVLEMASPYLDDSFEGEAVLSVGKIIEFHRQGFGGVVNVMPFGCMPSTIVSSVTMAVSRDCGNMPILNISFDGQEDPSLETRLEAFVGQVRQKKNSVKSIAEIAGAGF